MARPGLDRWRLGVATIAVLFAAADTYVVVVALPSMMAGVGVGLDRLQRATPIVTGFLLGYTAALPLIGRMADLGSTDRVFKGCLALFGAGSLITATAHSLPVVVTGRALQGAGAGGLVPVTLAMVARRWPAERRGTPLGVVGGAQELGSLLGPLYGAAIVAIASWRAIFWINLPLVIGLGAAFRVAQVADRGEGRPRRKTSWTWLAGGLLITAGAAAVALALDAPASLATSAQMGSWFAPTFHGPWQAFATPAALGGLALLALGALLALVSRSPRVGPTGISAVAGARAPRSIASAVDLPGAALLAGFLVCVVVVFSTADPGRAVLASSAPVLVPVALVLGALFWLRERTAADPLIPVGMFANRPAWGGLVVNLLVGAGLMAALVDIPLFARATVDRTSEVGAALVLLRLLIAVPLGALAGGALCRRRSLAAPVAAAGLVLAALSFLSMAGWSTSSIGGGPRPSDLSLIAAGFGLGLAIAPVNVAVLGAVEAGTHAVASALAVVARTVGMLAGLSALTAVALHRFYEAQARIGSPLILCPANPTHCPRYDDASTAALLSELHTVFAGAAICCTTAGLLSLWLLRPSRRSTRGGQSRTLVAS